MGKVPDPHKGSKNGKFGFHSAMSNKAAAKLSFKGASPTAGRYPRRCKLVPELSKLKIA